MLTISDWQDARATYFTHTKPCETCGRNVRPFQTAMLRQRFAGYQAMHVACWKRLCLSLWQPWASLMVCGACMCERCEGNHIHIRDESEERGR